jgi:hypothetical protein
MKQLAFIRFNLVWSSPPTMGALYARIASPIRTGKAIVKRRGCQLKITPVSFTPGAVILGPSRETPPRYLNTQTNITTTSEVDASRASQRSHLGAGELAVMSEDKELPPRSGSLIGILMRIGQEG